MKKSFIVVCSILMLFLWGLPAMAEDWSYDFETAKNDIGKQFHEHREVTLNNMKWKIYCVRNNDDGMDYVNGKGSMRIYGTKASMDNMPYFEMKANKEGGIGVVTFAYRAYEREKDTQVAWVVQVTEDDGAHWKNIGKPFTPTMEVQQFEAKAHLKNARIRIVREDYETFEWKNLGFKAMFNIDDMTITDAKEVDPNQPVITVMEDKINFGEVFKGEKKNLTCTFSYNNLSSPVALSIEGSSSFSLLVTEMAAQEGMNEATFDIEFAPATYGNFAATVTLRSGETESIVSVKGTGTRKPGDYSYSGGKGTEEEPYLIATSADIMDLSDAVNEKFTYSGKYFKMTADIDMADVSGMLPIGNNFGSAGSEVKTFCGTFDGDGYTINHLRMSFKGKEKIGVALFGVLQGATIKNLTIDNSEIKSDALTAGIAAAVLGGTITNCHLGKNVTIASIHQAYAAGIVCGVFSEAATITDCTSHANVSAVGMGVAGILASCGVNGTVVSRCVNYGSLSSNAGIVGGIVGLVEDNGSIQVTDCANFGKVTSPDNAGGIVALLSPSAFGPLNVANCYNNGEIDCYGNNHPVTLPNTGEMSVINITNSYYCTEKYTGDVKAAIGKTTDEMKTDAFAALLNDGRVGPWTRSADVNEGYPLPSGIEISENSILTAYDVTVPQHAYYRMFIKQYGRKLAEYVNAKNRFVVKYESDNEQVVASWGNAFKTVGTGEANVKMRIAGSLDGSLNAFDENNVLDEVSFHVKVEDFVTPTIPAINVSWGMEKEAAMKKEESFGHTKITETYWNMHPLVSEEAHAGVEIFATHNFEFPLSMLHFNAQGELIASDLIVSSWERVKTPEITPVCKLLKEKGYKYIGLSPETGQWQMYHEDSKTLATCGLVFVQNQSYYYFTLIYEPKSPVGINETIAELPEISVRTSGSVLEVTAEKYVGQAISVYSTTGQCLASATVKDGVNVFDIPSREVLIVKVGKHASVKVVR